MELRELSKDHPGRTTVERWWNSLGDRAKLMGTHSCFMEAFGESKSHSNFPGPGRYEWGAYDTAGRIVGFLAGQVDVDTPTQMGFVYLVDPNRQGAGFGTTMLRELSRDPGFAGFETFCCTVFPGNPASLRVMEKVGFVKKEDSEGTFTYSR